MFKIIQILFLLTTFLNAVQLDNSISLKSIKSSELFTYVDEKANKDIDYILENKDTIFKKIDKRAFSYSNRAIWTKVKLENVSKEAIDFYLINDFSALDKIDIYIVKNEKIEKKFLFGDTREVSKEEILNRFANVALHVKAKDNLEVFIRYASTTPIRTTLQVFSNSFYKSFILKDFTIWGFFTGLTIALILYNLMIYFSLKENAFLFYVLHAIVNLYNSMTSSGHVYAYFSPYISNDILNISYKITPPLSVIFMLLFIICLFDLRKNIRWLYFLNVGVIWFFALFMALLYLFVQNDAILLYNRLSAFLIPLSLVFIIFSSIIVSFKKLTGSLYFLLGTGGLIVGFFLYVMHFLGEIDLGIWVIYTYPIGRTVDIIFLSMALGNRIKKIEKQRLDNALLIEESNKFNSTSYLLAGILHQFKQPLLHLGSEVLNLRVFNFKRGEKESEEDESLTKIEKHIQDMNLLVDNFYSFYSKSSQNAKFNVAEAIEKTLSILSSSLKANDIEVVKEYETQSIKSDEKSLNQVLLIILENAISILGEREIENPKICLHVKKKGNHVNIIIRDNAGGIDAEDIDNVFTVHYSKRETKGLGIGLALAKNIVENKLKGTITVVNKKEGASFCVSL